VANEDTRVADTEVLRAAGSLYRATLTDGVGQPSARACHPRLSPAELASAQDLLLRLGLVRPASADPEALVPLAPEIALRSRLDTEAAEAARFAQRLVQCKAELEVIAGYFQHIHAEQLISDGVELVRGTPAIAEAVENAELAARHTACGLHPSPHTDIKRASELNSRSLQRGIAIRTVHLATHAGQPHVEPYLQNMAADGVALRLAGTLPCRMIIVDSSFALLWLAEGAEGSDPSPAALIVRSAPLTQFAIRIFEHFWSTALPWVKEGGRHQAILTERRRQLLMLMMSGLHDEAIARRLGVSVRTVRRLIADLMKELDAESRFQAGALAVARGWLPSRGPGPARLSPGNGQADPDADENRPGQAFEPFPEGRPLQHALRPSDQREQDQVPQTVD
jgi:DNA-binding CsgD family transcriptional regulator